jgi:hypothetical protein
MNLYFPSGIFNILFLLSTIFQAFSVNTFNYNSEILYKVRVLFSLM